MRKEEYKDVSMINIVLLILDIRFYENNDTR